MMQSEATLADVLKDVWQAKYSIMLFAALLACLGFVYHHMSVPLYKGSMIIAPADGYALGDYASSVSVGENVSLPFWRPTDPEGVSTDYYRFIHTLDGTSVAQILLKDAGVLAGIQQDEKNFARRTDLKAEELAAYLDKKLMVEFLGATPLRRITYLHPDRDFAAAFLRKIHLVSDQMIRRDRKRQSEARIAYLNVALESTSNPEHRKIITNLLMQQEHIRMLANLDEAYAAIIVEPASSAVKPYWPNAKVIYPVFILVGSFIGFLVWGLRHHKKT